MRQALLDTDIVSFFLRGDPAIQARLRVYLERGGHLNLSILTVYEVISGLKHKDAKRQLPAFRAFAARSMVWPVTERSVEISASLYAELRGVGKPVDDMDLLIAGIALAEDLVLVSHNVRNFGRIPGLTVEDWTETR